MAELKLTLPVPLSLNQLYISEYGWNPKQKKRVPTGRRILSKEGEKSKKQLQEQTIQQMESQSEWDYDYTLENFIYMDTIFVFNKKGRDDNNCYKLLCDALEKIVYDNDSRVLVRTQKILYDVENPHIKVTFSPVTYVGVFDNQDIFNEFKNKCETCTRFKNNCSILKKATEGRIQEEIDSGYICSKYKEIKKS